MHNNTNNSDRMNTVAYKIGQAIALRRDLSRLFSPAEYKCPTLL